MHGMYSSNKLVVRIDNNQLFRDHIRSNVKASRSYDTFPENYRMECSS